MTKFCSYFVEHRETSELGSGIILARPTYPIHLLAVSAASQTPKQIPGGSPKSYKYVCAAENLKATKWKYTQNHLASVLTIHLKCLVILFILLYVTLLFAFWGFFSSLSSCCYFCTDASCFIAAAATMRLRVFSSHHWHFSLDILFDAF